MTDQEGRGGGGAIPWAEMQQRIGCCPLCGKQLSLCRHFDSMKPESRAWDTLWAHCAPCGLMIDPDCRDDERALQIMERRAEGRAGGETTLGRMAMNDLSDMAADQEQEEQKPAAPFPIDMAAVIADQPCSPCHGRGTIETAHDNGSLHWVECPACKGNGRHQKEKPAADDALIERVARAICDADPQQGIWESGRYHELARAAIAAVEGQRIGEGEAGRGSNVGQDERMGE